MKSNEIYHIIERNKPDSFALMDPELKKALEFDLENLENIQKESPYLKDDEKGLYDLARRVWNENQPHVFEKKDIVLDGPHGELACRVYRSDEKNNKPCIIFYHGGGFVVGGLDSHDGIVSRLCNFSGANVIAIDYRLAPENKFPVPLEEGVFVTDYVRRNAREFHINPEQISFAGDSAGAFLSLVTFLHLRETQKDVSYIKTLLLYYGSVGLSDSVSKRLYGGYWDGLTYSELDRYQNTFFAKDESAYTLIDRDYTKAMPATFILGCGLDPLADDSRVLFEILKAKGHTVELAMKKAYIHAFLHYSNMLPGAVNAIRESAEFFKNHCGA